MSCMTVELPGNSLRWFNKPQGFEYKKTAAANMSCIVASATGSPVLGSCRSPSVVGLHDDIEICCGSPLRSPLNGFQTPKGVRISCKDGGMCRSPVSLTHEFECNSGGVLRGSSSPLKARHAVASPSSSFLRASSSSSSSPTQENLGCRNIQNCLLGSRLRPVLAAREVNHLRIENRSNSPVKKTHQRIVPVPFPVFIPLCSTTGREDDGCEDFNGDDEILNKKPPSPPLKRKRPPRLDIPQSTSMETQPLINDLPKEINMEGSHYAVACKKGRREIMEDTHKAMVNLHGDSKQAFFGVFDGHGGRKAADFAAENIGHNIVNALVNMGDQEEDNIIQAVRSGYLATDAEFLKQGVSSGTSCVTALIKDGNLVVSNAGDCRAVISRDGDADALTCDHRAAREDERVRIENLGGYVDCRHGVWRVQGVLAISRGIGDLHMKDWITAEPETKKIEITSDCEFLILASDGLWDKVTDQEAVDLARPFCLKGKPNVEPAESLETGELSLDNTKLPLRGPLAACRKLVELSVARGSLDDVSVMIVQLGNFCGRIS